MIALLLMWPALQCQVVGVGTASARTESYAKALARETAARDADSQCDGGRRFWSTGYTDEGCRRDEELWTCVARTCGYCIRVDD